MTLVMELLFVLSLFWPPSLQAREMRLTVAPGIVATADFKPGTAGPAVLLVHGFLQTRRVPAIRGLAKGLHDDGFTILAPNLSLGVTVRHDSLACGAIHTHTLRDGAREIGLWVGWLRDRGYRDVALVGHGRGDLNIISYLDHHADPAVRRAILTRLQWFGSDAEAAAARARADQRRGLRVGRYPLAFCNAYVAPPVAYLSYARWDVQRVLMGLERVHLPVTVIMGKRRQLRERAWLARLRRAACPVALITPAPDRSARPPGAGLLAAVARVLDGSR